ncbi:hypothetical protein V5F77_04295 [Xanthobacter sp. DSM 24535]|uniref:DUF6874 family protein n=1 Tax=Roseixanthobacter psychrophilus TaxID=3119917 RepID=UPI0037263412
MTAITKISFERTPEDDVLIRKIIERAADLGIMTKRAKSLEYWKDCQQRWMDLVATHANGCPMDFERLLAADDFNFTHDFTGIVNCLDRTTGRLGNSFHPRFARKEG